MFIFDRVQYMDQLIYIQIVLCLREFLERIFGMHYPTELVKLVVLSSYKKIKINCGWEHSSVMINGSVYVWGKNCNGELGLGHTNNVLVPHKLQFDNIKSMNCGVYNIVALTNKGELYESGIESNSFRLMSHNVLNTTQIKIISCKYNKLIILAKQNRLYTWKNYSKITKKKIIIDGFKKIKSGGHYTAVLTKFGKIFTMGQNCYGQLGLGLGHHTASLDFQEVGLENIVIIECGLCFTIAVSLTNKVYVWGWNEDRQLGLGDTNNRNLPCELEFNMISKIMSVSCGASHTMVLLQNAQIYVWGFNAYGQLGLGHNDYIRSPQKLVLKHIVKIKCGANYTFALTTSDEIYVWGRNDYGQLGLGSRIDQYTPTKLDFKFKFKF